MVTSDADGAAELRADVLVVGAGMGGVAAALAVARRGLRVVLTDPGDWVGGALTSQLVPLDEHRRIERLGATASYRRLREGLRAHYRRYYPLTDRARRDPLLNPGAGWVSPLCVEPRAAVSVLESMLAPYRANGSLRLLPGHVPVAVEVDADRVLGVTFRRPGGESVGVTFDYVLDATETGDLLPLADVEHVVGRESRDQTGEPSAAATADPTDVQSGTWCFVVDHVTGADHTIERPADYDFWRAERPPGWGGARILDWTGPVESEGFARPYRFEVNPDDDPAAIDTDHRHMPLGPELWTYRRIAARRQFRDGFLASDITVVNWPMNDYTGGPLFGAGADHHRAAARQLSLSLLYWLQTEAPRPDGGTGYPGLRPRPDVAGTSDGLAMEPYIRESRRISAVRTILEQDVSVDILGDRAATEFPDTVGIGHYYWLDRHATTGGGNPVNGRPQPFQIPLGALVPVRVRNLLAAGKNLGTTHITNGCYRLHPVEWNVGESAGTLAAQCLRRGVEPHKVWESPDLLGDLQRDLVADGVELHWPPGTRW